MSLFGTSAKYIDALAKAGLKPRQTHDLRSLRTVTSSGSPLAPESFDYVYRDIKADLHLASISGGTDLISCFALGNSVAPVWRGEIQTPGLGVAAGVNDTRIVLCVVPRPGLQLTAVLTDKIKTQIRTTCSPRRVPAKIVQVGDIPRMKNGKIAGLAVRDVIHGRPVRNADALTNPQALNMYRDIAALRG